MRQTVPTGRSITSSQLNTQQDERFGWKLNSRLIISCINHCWKKKTFSFNFLSCHIEVARRGKYWYTQKVKGWEVRRSRQRDDECSYPDRNTTTIGMPSYDPFRSKISDDYYDWTYGSIRRHQFRSARLWLLFNLHNVQYYSVFRLCPSSGKSTVYPLTGYECPEGEQRYSSTLSLTSVLYLEWEVNATLRPLYPGKETWYPLYRRSGGPQGRSRRMRKISPLPRFDPWTA